MWIMTSYGILMPAALPPEVPAFDDGWNLQVRSRDRRTLKVARKRMIERGYGSSGIVATPELDYEYRFYCRAADFAAFIGGEIAEIDYEKFKPTTDRFKGGRRLHGLYNRIWSVVAAHYDTFARKDATSASLPLLGRDGKPDWWDDAHPLDGEAR